MNIRQAVRIVNISNRETLRTGDRATVRFEFKYHPEYIQEGMRIILREGGCKAIGVISTILYDEKERTITKTKKLKKLKKIINTENSEEVQIMDDNRKRLKVKVT